MAPITTLSLPRFSDRNGNGNGKAAPEAKSIPAFNFPLEMFFDVQDQIRAEHGLDRVRGLNAYAVFALAYSCMTYRATKLVEAPLWIAEESGGGEEWLEGDHPLAKLLEQPNPDMEMVDLLETLSLYLDATGRGLLYKNRNRGQQVVSLYPFSGDEFSIEPSDERLFGTFTLYTSRGPKEVPPEDVIFFRHVDPRSATSGLGPLDAALEHVNIGVDMRKAIRATLINAVRPGAKVEYDKNWTDDEFKTFKERLEAGHAGATRQGRTVYLEGGAKLELLKSSLKELELGPVQGDVESAICSCFQIHPAVVGARIGLENSSAWSDVIKSATELFYDVVAFPRWARMEKILTRSLLREIDPNPLRFIRFDKTKIRALQKDLTARTTEATAAAGYWMVDEQRLHTGQQPHPDPEIGQQLGRMVVPVGGSVSGTDRSKPPAPPARGKAEVKADQTSGQDAHRLVEQALFDTQAAMLELVAASELRTDEQAISAILAKPAAKAEDEPKLTAAERRAIEHQVDAYLETAAARWTEAFDPPLTSIASGAVERVALQVGVDFSLLQPGISGFVQRETAFLVTAVSDTTRQKIRDALSEGLEHGEAVRQIERRIQEAGTFSRDRAKLIAGTEITRARTGAGRESMSDYEKEYSVPVTKEWVNARDAKVRTAHRNKPTGVGGERVGVNEPFSNGLQHPSEPNCRCTLFFHVEAA